jgi:hypothetical protein
MTGACVVGGNVTGAFVVGGLAGGAANIDTGGAGYRVVSDTNSAGTHNHTFTTDATGSSGTNANLPPYYALAYIMKS